MFDANYFRSSLPRDIEATGGSPIVEVVLRGGHVHRVRSVVDVGDGWVTLEVYQVKGDLSHERPRFGTAATAHELVRAVVAYESVATIVLDPAPTQTRARPGFGFSPA
ncbi:MAG: hypothetical protein JWL60_2375 [Gemmatimonadetes bacterium]|jgi:hypothetical protein|nr:hypothetical protein [Gemmatimonadota bacterium]